MLKGAKTWTEMREELPAEDREAIAERVRAIRRAGRLQDIREIVNKRQADVTGMSQVSVSRLEGRDDWLVSSVNTYVRGLGGRLKIVAEMPEVGEIELLVDDDGHLVPPTEPARKARAKQ